MKKAWFPIVLSIIITILLITMNQNIATIKFFPIDEHNFFIDTSTQLDSHRTNNKVIWKTHSTSSEQGYLRQDVALLYENGYFKGLQNVWKQDVAELNMEQHVQLNQNSLLQTITFHHSEFHHPNKNINSIHHMSADHLYVVTTNSSWQTFRSTNIPTNNIGFFNIINDDIKQQYQRNEDELINFFNIDRSRYIAVPLIDLIQFNDHPILDLSMETTEQIIGQLWEGLYSQYITLLIQNTGQVPLHFMPLILIDKEKDHLLIIFKIEHENYQFIQKLPS